jgi:hypothetical protein
LLQTRQETYFHANWKTKVLIISTGITSTMECISRDESKGFQAILGIFGCSHDVYSMLASALPKPD